MANVVLEENQQREQTGILSALERNNLKTDIISTSESNTLSSNIDGYQLLARLTMFLKFAISPIIMRKNPKMSIEGHPKSLLGFPESLPGFPKILPGFPKSLPCFPKCQPCFPKG